MSMTGRCELEEAIVSVLKDFSGRSVIDVDEMIGRDLGIRGGDGVQILYELEERFKIDLEPLIQSSTTYLPPSWLDRLRGRKHVLPTADVSVRELVCYIRMRKQEDASGFEEPREREG